MKSDIEIAQECRMAPIDQIGRSLGLSDDDLELYGKYKLIVAGCVVTHPKQALRKVGTGYGHYPYSGRRRENHHHSGIGSGPEPGGQESHNSPS